VAAIGAGLIINCCCGILASVATCFHFAIGVMSGRLHHLAPLVTPSARTLPDRTCGSITVMVSTERSIVPPRRSVIGAVPPR
jgi:hypothetical protein